jgi:hypothetical protein
MNEPLSDAQIIEYLNRFIVLNQWDKKLPIYMARLLANREHYEQARDAIRRALSESEPSKLVPPQPVSSPLSADEWDHLYLALARAAPLRELFGSDQDPFPGDIPDHVAVLAELSDLTTDPQTMAYSRYGAFLSILEALRQSPSFDLDKQIQEGLEKFFALYDDNIKMAEMLAQLAGSSDWHTVLAALRDRRDYTEGGDAADTLKKWNQELTAEVRAQLFKPAHLSRVSKNLVKLAWDGRELFDEARKSTSAADISRIKSETRKRITDAALPLFLSRFSDQIASVKFELNLLATAARHYIRVRKFAKLDAFVYTWPKIATLAMENYPNLEFVEDCLIIRRQAPPDSDLDAKDARELYELCATDRTLIRFLRLRPYFSEIDDNELRRYQPLAPVVISPPAAAAAVMPAAAAIPDAPILSKDATQTVRSTPSAIFRTCEVMIENDPSSTSGDENSYRVTLDLPGQPVVTSLVTFSVRRLLDEMYRIMGVPSEDSLQPYLKEIFSGSGANSELVVARAGTYLLNTILGDFVEPLAHSLREDKVRIVIRTRGLELNHLPWEWMPRPNSSELLVRNPNFSIVRSFSRVKVPTPPPLLINPLRLLALMPSWGESSYPVAALQSVALSDQLQLRLVTGLEATLANTVVSLKSFDPQIVHLEGHVDTLPNVPSSSYILFPDGHGLSSTVDERQFGDILFEHNIQLVVIGRNDVQRLYDNPTTNLAAYFSLGGMPAVVAPVRGIDEATAQTFTTELYRSFVQGNTLEVAVSDARRKLSSRGGDWTAFALFADPATLDFFSALPVAP